MASRWRASASSITAILLASAAPCTPVPGPGPILAGAAEQRGAQRRRRRGVGDAHLAQAQDVDAGLGRHHAVGHGVGDARLAHRRALGEVLGRMVEIELVDAQVGVDRAGELVDRGAAVQEVLHHLLGDFRRIGRDAAPGDAMRAGEDGDPRPLDARLGAALPAGQPFGELLQPAERARRLGQLGLAAHHMGLRFEVRSRQVAQDAAHLVESGAGM